MCVCMFAEPEVHHYPEKKETPINLAETASLTGNHLGIPKPAETNPNLLSPEILNQRRGRIWGAVVLFRTNRELFLAAF